MRVFPLLCALAALSSAVPLAVATADDFDTVLERERRLLLAGPPSTGPTEVRALAGRLDAQGAWPDINYTDNALAEWTPRHHLDRVLTMLQATLQPSSPLHGDEAVTAAANRALDHWLATRPHGCNWWHNEIGTPGFMRDIILLLGNTLGGPRRDGALEVLHQFKVGGSGANLVWSAGLAFNLCLFDQGRRAGRSMRRTVGGRDSSVRRRGHPGGFFLSSARRAAPGVPLRRRVRVRRRAPGVDPGRNALGAPRQQGRVIGSFKTTRRVRRLPGWMEPSWLHATRREHYATATSL